MARLKSALLSKYSSQRDRVKVFNPRNCEELCLYFKGEKIAKVYIYSRTGLIQVVGSLANKTPHADHILNGVLVQKDFNMSLIAAEDLREFAGLETNVVMQRQTIAFHGGLPLLKWHLDQMFGGVILESGNEGRKPMFKVMDAVVVVFESASQLSINWIGNAMNDTIADAVLAIIISAETSPASLKGIPFCNSNCSRRYHLTPCRRPPTRPSQSHPSFPRSTIRRCNYPGRRWRRNPRRRRRISHGKAGL